MMRHDIGLHSLVWRKLHDIPWHDRLQLYCIILQVYTTAAIAAERVKIGEIQLGEQLGKEGGKGRGATMTGRDQSIVISGDTTHTVPHCTTPHTYQHNSPHHIIPPSLISAGFLTSQHISPTVFFTLQHIFLPVFLAVAAALHCFLFFLLLLLKT